MLDEVTANVDLKTDNFIQSIIRTEFRDSTVIAIAHRLNTIINYDRVLVLDQGQVAQYDTPQRLLKQKGIFQEMASAEGI